MRIIFAAIAAFFLASCASAPSTETAKVSDQKSNTLNVSKQSQSEFVGTSASARPAKVQPGWYKFGHP